MADGIDAGSVYSEVRIKLDKLDQDIAKVDAKFNILKKDNEKQVAEMAANQAKAANSTKKSWISSFSATKVAAVAAFAIITQTIKEAVKIGATFEQSIANVASVAGGSAQEMEELRQAAQEAGETTRFTASQAADALYSLASAGLDAKDSINALDGVLEFAGATQSDLATSSALVVSTLKQYNLDATEATTVSNVFAAGIGNSLGTMSKFKLALQQVGPVAGAMNISLEETVGQLSALFDAGFKGETAGRALKSIYADLADETSEVNKQLSNLGFSFDEVNPATNDFADIIDVLNSKGLTAGEIIAAFGKEAGPEIIALMNAGGDAIREYTKDVTGTTAATEMYKKQNDTLSGSFDKMKSALQGLAIQFTQSITPSLRAVLDTVTNIANKIAGSNKEVEQTYDDLETSIDDLKTATDNYNKILADSEGKTDAVTQAMVAQAKAARDLALQQAGSAYAESNANLEDYNKTLNSSTNWVNKLSYELSEYAKGTGYSIDQLNKMAPTQRSKILLDQKGEKVLTDYNIAMQKYIYYTDKKQSAESNLQKSEANRITFVNQLTAAYLDEDEVTKMLLNAYPELSEEVLNNVDAYKAKTKAEEEALKAAQDSLQELKEMGELNESQIENAKAIGEYWIENAQSAKEKAVWTEYLSVATAAQTAKEEEAIATAEELAAKEKNRNEILDTLNASIDEARKLEESLGANYDENTALSKAYLTAIEDLIANGEDPHSEKLQDLIDKYRELNPIISEATDKYQQSAGWLAYMANGGTGYLEWLEQQKQATADAAEKAKEDAEKIKQAQEQIVTEFSGILGSLSSLFSAMADKRMEEIDAELQAELEKNDLIEESTIERLQNELAETQATHAEELALIDAQIAAAEAAGDAESAIILRTNREQLLSDQEEVESEQQKAIDKAEIEAEYEKKKAQEQYKYDMFAWGASLAQATTDSAVAILKTMSSTPYPWNIALAAAQGVAGGVQLATISANKPTAPALATGGVVLPRSGGVNTIQAENGFPEVDLNMGPSGEPLINSLATRIANIVNSSKGSESKDITIYLELQDSKPFSKAVAKDINNGTVRIKL